MTERRPDVSVIVPVYNSENWLDDCLSSVLKQTGVSLEVICIDDGSTDGSASVLGQYAERDPRVTVLTQSNRGLSIARNSGLDEATGRYVAFLDSDDYWDSDQLGYLVERADRGRLDVLSFEARAIRDPGTADAQWNPYASYYPRSQAYGTVQPGAKLMAEMRASQDYLPAAWLYLFRTNFVANLGLRFVPGIIHEDHPFTFALMLQAERTAHVKKVFYVRRVRPGSIMTTPQATKSAQGYFTSYVEMVRHVVGVELDPNISKLVAEVVSGVFRLAVRHSVKIDDAAFQALRATDRNADAQVAFDLLSTARANASPQKRIDNMAGGSSETEVDLGSLASFRNYRFGFIALPSSMQSQAPRGWRTEPVGDWYFLLHPEASLDVFHGDDGRAAVLLGDAFSLGSDGAEDLVRRMINDPDNASALDQLGGRWAVFLFGPGLARVYHDALGSRSVYWRSDGVVASHAGLFEEILRTPRRDDVLDFVSGSLYKNRTTVKYLPGDLTLFEDVYALIPNNYFDLSLGCTVRYWPRNPLQPIGVEELLSELETYMRALARFVDSSGHRVTLGATGGVDSRLVMAGLLRWGADVETFTSNWHRLKPAERFAVNEVVRKGGLRHHIMPDMKRGDFVDSALRNSGGIGGSSPTVEWFAREFSEPDSLFITGHGGEVVCSPSALRKGRPTVRSYEPRAWSHAYSKVRPGVGVSPDHEQFVEEAFEGYFQRGNMDELHSSGVHPQDLYYWEHRMGMWCGGNVMNAFDAGMKAIPAFNARSIFEMSFSVDPVEDRRTKQIFKDLISRLYPELAVSYA